MKWEHYLFTILVILILGALVLINSQRTPGFSEVYFDNATIPAYLTLNTTYNMVFVIESHENEPENYSFRIYLNDVVIKEGNISLNPGTIVQIPFEFFIHNVTYKKVVLWKQTTTYNLSGIHRITGNCMGEGILIINNSDGEEISGCLPPLYAGPSNLSFIMNTSKNVTLSRIVENRSNASIVVGEYKLTLTKLDGDNYEVVVEESKILYLPEPVTIKVMVTNSAGKIYQIFKRFPIVGG